MADSAVIAAVEAQLQGFDGCLVLGINREGQAPADGSDYIVIQQPVADRRRLALNQKTYLEEGVIRFVIHTAIGMGDEAARAHHAALLPLLQDVRLGAVRFWTPGPLTPDGDASDGNYYVTSFPAPYSVTTHG